MKARRAARELALLVLFQLEKQGQAAVDPDRSLDDLILDAVRALVDQATDQIQSTAKDLASVSQYVLDTELDHPENLEGPMEAASKPVPIPTTREMLERIETVLQGAENLAEAIRIPELAAHARSEDVRNYAIRLVQLVQSHQESIDERLNKHSDDWKVSRLVKMDRDVLRMAVAEIEYVEDVDAGVAIDEAVELAKQFSSEDSFRLINGILGKLAESSEAASSEVPHV